jgi:hypothetical protein
MEEANSRNAKMADIDRILITESMQTKNCSPFNISKAQTTPLVKQNRMKPASAVQGNGQNPPFQKMDSCFRQCCNKQNSFPPPF